MSAEPLIQSFVDLHLQLLELERRAEVDEAVRLRKTASAADLQRRGLALLRLRLTSIGAGLGGRTLLELASPDGAPLAAHRFQPGDIVSVSPAKGAAGAGRELDAVAQGVLFRAGEARLTVAVDDLPEDELPDLLRLDRLANDVTHRRLRAGLETLRRYRGTRARRVVEVSFGLRAPSAPGGRARAAVDFFDASLDPSQRVAVAAALVAPELALVHGPPGTGKTTVLVEIIRQCVRERERVLACANSNVAVDHLAERLAAAGVGIVRLGHPARLLPGVVEHALDTLVERAEDARVTRDLRRELEVTQRRAARARDRAERRNLRQAVGSLRRELRALEHAVVRGVIERAEVVLATNVGAADRMLDDDTFDRVVVDEAAQAIEASCWIPLLKGERGVLAGDHRQLPPTILSPAAARGGLETTLFDRLASSSAGELTRMLTVQYRMHERIMRWPSTEFYGGRLEAHASVRGHRLADLPHVAGTEETESPLLLIDTAGCGFEEATTEDDASRANPGEAQLVAAHVEALTGAGLRAQEIAVITPYNAQVALLRSRIRAAHPELEIDSVDGFQGREKEAVVLSLVRSNPEGNVGFLADERRLNVALTRARRHLAVICDTATVSRDPCIDRLIAYLQEHGLYRSGWEYR